MYKPTPADVKLIRESVQRVHGIASITQAQQYCADEMDVHRRTWQKWENGEAPMHTAFWYCAERVLP